MTWPTASLKAISCFGPQYGANASAIARTGTRPRYVRITDIDSDGRLLADGAVEADLDDDRQFLLKEGDLLFARSGNTVGKAYLHRAGNGPCVFAGYLIRFRPAPDLADSRYVFFFTQSTAYKSWVVSRKRVAGQPNVNGTEYSALQFPLPALKEQRRIVELLEQADGLRRKRTEADRLANHILPALFRKMFGDPVANDKGWPAALFGEIAESRLGKMLDAKQQTGEHRRPYLRNLNVQWARFDLSSVLEMDFPPEQRNEFLLRQGDLLICEGGEVGRSAIWDEQIPECYFQKALHRVRPHTNKCVAEYLLYLLWALARRGGLIDLNSKATIPHLTGVQLAALQIPLPPVNLQRAFAGLVQRASAVTQKRLASGNKLEALFRTMLHRAFTGDLTAKWHEAHLKELLAEMEQQARLLESAKAEAN